MFGLVSEIRNKNNVGHCNLLIIIETFTFNDTPQTRKVRTCMGGHNDDIFNTDLLRNFLIYILKSQFPPQTINRPCLSPIYGNDADWKVIKNKKYRPIFFIFYNFSICVISINRWQTWTIYGLWGKLWFQNVDEKIPQKVCVKYVIIMTSHTSADFPCLRCVVKCKCFYYYQQIAMSHIVFVSDFGY